MKAESASSGRGQQQQHCSSRALAATAILEAAQRESRLTTRSAAPIAMRLLRVCALPAFITMSSHIQPRGLHVHGHMGSAETRPNRRRPATANMSRKTSTIWPNADRHALHPPQDGSSAHVRLALAATHNAAWTAVGRGVHKRLQARVRRQLATWKEYITLPRLCSTGCTNCPILCTH
jgi:hypothetical protein